MAIYTVGDANEIRNAILASGPGDTIKCLPGVYTPWACPKSIAGPLLITANGSVFPEMQGVQFGSGNDGGNFVGVPLSPAGATFKNITMSGIRIKAKRYTSIRNPSGTLIQTPGPGGSGYGWRYQPPVGAPAGQWGENGGLRGLILSSSVSDFTLEDSIINGFAKQVHLGNPTRVTIQQCDLHEGCEDGLFIAGCRGLTLLFNHFYDWRPLTLKEAQDAFDWRDGKAPHCDFAQNTIKVTDLWMEGNLFDGDEGSRVHVGLLKLSDADYAGGIPGVGEYHQRWLVNNNLGRCTASTGWWLKYIEDLEFTNNVLRRIKDSGVSGDNMPSTRITAFGDLGVQASQAPNAIVTGNVAFRLYPRPESVPGSWTWEDNVESNTAWPADWYEIEEGVVAPGERFAGVGGNDGVIPVPTKPLQLTLIPNDFSFHSWTRDPDLPLSDTRRVPVIAIPTTSKAKTAAEVRWQNPVDTGARGTVEIGVGAAGERLFRMTSNGDFHRVVPGTSLTFGVFWAKTVGGTRSDRSSVDATTPTLPGVAPPPAPVFADTPDFTIALAIIHDGNDVLAWIPDGYRTPVWTKP